MKLISHLFSCQGQAKEAAEESTKMTSKEKMQSFAKLKKDLLFHEKRLQLLLTSRVLDEFESSLHEKSLSRQECADDCRKALENFEIGAAEAVLSGRWDELRVVKRYGLEVPLTYVVGSQKFEAPKKADCNSVTELLNRLHKIAARFPEYHTEADEDPSSLKALVERIGEVSWSGLEMAKIAEAVNAKLGVLTELDDLSDALHQCVRNVSTEKSSVEDLRRREEVAERDGEMAVADAALRDKIEALGRVVDHNIERCGTIGSSKDENVTKKKSNTRVFQGASIMLEHMMMEKKNLADSCHTDLTRLKRGLEFEEKNSVESRTRGLKESLERIQQLDARQTHLTARLLEVYKDFQETEAALEKVGNERSRAIQDHVDLVEERRQANIDAVELVAFATVHRKNLEVTKSESEKGIRALEALEKMLLQEQNFDSYDFKAAAHRMNSMEKWACFELNQALSEYETAANELLRRRTAKEDALKNEIDLIFCEAELKKDSLDPEVKRDVLKARELEKEQTKISDEIARLHGKVMKRHDAAAKLILLQLSPEMLEDAEKQLLANLLRKREDLVDMRSELGISPESHIVDERLRLLRERQVAPVTAQRPKSREAEKTGKSSRVLNVREEVQKSKQALAELLAEEERQSAATSATTQLPSTIYDLSAVDASAAVEGSAAVERRRPRVIKREFELE